MATNKVVTDTLSGCSFEAFTPWLESLKFEDVEPCLSSSNPKTDLYPSVCVTWGRRVGCCGGPVVTVGVRYEYVLRRTPDGCLRAELRWSSGHAGWCGRTKETLPVDQCPRHVKQMALAALRREQNRRFDGCTYVVGGYLPE